MPHQRLDFVNVQRRRWYQLELMRDLLGDLVVVRRWGGLGSRLGNCSVHVPQSLAEARTCIERELARRLARGYQLTM